VGAPGRTPQLTVVCPVYNEAGSIGRQLDALAEAIAIPIEMLVVYDYDDDDTLPVVRQKAGSLPFAVRLVRNRFGQGALNAIKTGFLEARTEAVLVTMADLSDDLRVVGHMHDLIGAGYDVVCASRYMPGGRQIGGRPFKNLLSRTAGLSLYHLAGVPTRDATNSFKMYRTEFLRSVEFESKGGFEIGLEAVVKAFVSGRRIAEVPATWTDRVAGKSRFRLWKWLPHYLRWYLYAFRGAFRRRAVAARLPS
jgi:glycosyltransferase involved in cell wall biosynthesis